MSTPTIRMQAPTPWQQFPGCPSGATYVADNNGLISAVQPIDVLAMLKADCSFASISGGIVRQRLTGSGAIGAATNYASINQSAAGTYTLAGGHADGFALIIKDVGENFSTYPATIVPATGETIEGQASYVMSNNGEEICPEFDATNKNWDVT